MRIKSIFKITLLTIASNFTLAQDNFTFNQGQSKSVDYFAVIPYENSRGKILIEALINEKPYKFILDTGAPTTLSTDVYNELKPKTINKLPIYDQSGKVDSMVVVSLVEMSIGDIKFIDIPSLVAKKNLILECFQADGIIGSNLLRNSIIQFDNSNKTISITNDENKLNLKSIESSELFLDKMQSSPFIWIKIENKKVGNQQLLFDSGMEGLYDLSLTHYKIFEKKNIFKIIGRANGSNSIGLHGASNDTLQYKLRLPKMKINGSEFNNVSVNTTTSSNSRIGSKLLELGLVTIDYRNKKFYFTSKSDQKIDLLEKSFPVDLIYRNDQIQIGVVWDDSLRGKIKPGDQIIAADDISYGDIDVCELIRNESRFKGKDKITLTIKTQSGVVDKVMIVER